MNFTKISNFTKFIILLSILTVFDYFTTNYLLENALGVEGNPTMSSIVSDHLTFALIKSFGVIMIIGLYRTINEKYKDNLEIQKISLMGQRLIILMYFLVIFNNIFVIQASALTFNNFSFGGTAGSVNTGNGYFDDDATSYGYSDTRNVYIVAEPREVWMFVPECLSTGCTNFNSFQTVNSTTGLLKDAVVFNGYVYFVDGSTLKKKKTRAVTNVVESTDDSAGGSVLNISTGVGESLRVYNGVLFFTKGTNGIYHLDSEDNEVFDFTMPKSSTNAQIRGFTPFYNNSILTVYTSINTGAPFTKIAACTQTSCSVLESGNLPAAIVPTADTYYSTATKIYGLTIDTADNTRGAQCIYLVSNGTCSSSTIITDTSIDTSRRAYVGSRTTVGLLANTATYSTFNSVELGFDSLPTTQTPDIIYTTKTIQSLKSTYYNRSDIFLQYQVDIDNTDLNNLVLDLSDYRWMVAMTDPNGVSKDVTLSSECSFPTGISFTCSAGETLQFAWPSPGWLQGTWSAQLYEINVMTQHRALIATSSSFTVLNTTVDNQSIIQPPTQPITSGSSPVAISTIDQMVAWLGLGINSVSKLLFAMIWIAAFGAIGLFKSNGNVAMALCFVPYGFFTYIEYIPKWMFITYIILLAIVSKAFR